MVSDALENWWRHDADFFGGKKILMGNAGYGRYWNEKNTEHYESNFMKSFHYWGQPSKTEQPRRHRLRLPTKKCYWNESLDWQITQDCQ